MSIKREKLRSATVNLLLVVMAVAYIYPVIFMVLTSFKSNSEIYKNMWALPRTLYPENYINAFQVGHLGDYFFNSVIIAAIALFSVIIIGTLAAYALARLHLGYAVMLVGTLFIIQIMPVESMIIPLYMMMSKLSLFKVIYLPIVLAYIGWMLPGTIVILRNFFMSVPSELLESARIDGSNEWNTMFRIVFPMAGGAVATCTVFNFGFAWGELMWAQIATLTTERGVPLAVGLINFQGQFTTNWGMLTAAICMILIPLIALYVFLQRYFVKGLTAGAIKG